MNALPPLPRGFRIDERPDLWVILQAEGFVATNGFRTDADVEDIRRQGYTPAAKGAHNRGDGVDLTHPTLSPRQQAKRLRELARKHGWRGAVVLDEGHHRHFAVPGWGAAPGTPGTPNGGLPLMPKGFKLERRGSLTGGNFQPTGEAYDGDTIDTNQGRVRLRGADAFELKQTGRTRTGEIVRLGANARNALLSFASPDATVTPTNALSYGRPVVTLNHGGDAGQSVIRQGWALAAPEYLRGSRQFGPYMEAERLARANLLGAHGNTYQTPESFRAGNPDPWEKPEAVAPGEQGTAVFADEPMPFMGLRPEIEKGYLAIWNDPKSKPEDLIAFARANGFEVSEEFTRKQYAKRFKGGDVPDSEVVYNQPPRLLTDPGDGAFGSFARGFGDPVNLIDELGGVADTVGVTPGRENIWNSDRRFGDVLWNNIDQNRSILQHDDEKHPIARLGGQLTSGVMLPAGVARTPVQLAKVGAIWGGAAGFGAGEGDPLDRAPNALLGAGMGGAAGYGLGRIGEEAVDLYRTVRGTPAGEAAIARGGVTEAAPIVNDGPQSPPPAGVVSAMRVDDEGAELVGPAAPLVRERDYLDLPPLPRGFRLEEPFGGVRPTDERLSPGAMAKLAEDVDPRSVLPRPSNIVESLSEAQRANPGRFVELEAPNPLNELPVRQIPSRTDLYRSTRIRGPLDLTQRLRSMGGMRDEGGELSHLGVTNEPRKMDWGSNEQFLGKLVNNERGLPLDEATFRLWEEGWFPEMAERPTPRELLDRLKLESMGKRFFHPDDQPLVERFYAARDEADRINRAFDEGVPLVDERGESINLDDLVANTPPVEAYEEMPRLTGRIGNINLGRLGRPQEVAQLIRQVSQRVGGLSAAARGRITHDETQRLAQELGVKPEQLLRRRQGQALNAEELYASRALVQRSRETVARLARTAVSGGDDSKLAFRKAWLAHVALEEQISGATAEAGRALSQMRMLARAQDAGANAVSAYLRGIGGKERLDEAAEAIVDLMEDPARANHFMREAVKPRWRDKFNELWVNSLLSGPRTHVVNFVGNTLTTALSFPEQAMTAAIGKVTRSVDRAYFGEVGARAVGLADSSVEALRNMRRAFRSGEAQDWTSKIDAVHQKAIGGRLGEVVRIPTRALTAADEFWKTLLNSAELRQLAYRKAMRETGGGDGFRARYEALLRAPSEDMVKQAQSAARYYTFQKELGPTGRGVQAISNNWLGGKILLPFVRTPINLLKFAGERSVFGLAMPEVRAVLRAGGRVRDEALAKITLGSGLSTAAVIGAMGGKITGSGPTDPRERAALLQAGWQPNSIRVGDQWVSYARFDPVSTLFGVAADFAEVGQWATRREADALALNLAQGIAKNVTNKTWLSGLSDAFDVLSDPERYGKGYVQRLAGSAVVPSGVNQAAQALDPHLRDARSIVDGIKARVPILSESLPVRRNVWGDPVPSGDAVGPKLVSPFYASKISREPLAQEIARLRVPLSMPKRYLTIEGRRVDLTAEQYDALVQLSGKPAKQYLEQAIRSPEWRSMTDDERREEVKEVLEDFRAAAREELKARYPELGGGAANDDVPPLPWGFVQES